MFASYVPPTLDVIKEALERAALNFTYVTSAVSEVELIIGSPPETPTDEAVLALSATRFEERLAEREHDIEAFKGLVSDQSRLLGEAISSLQELAQGQTKSAEHIQALAERNVVIQEEIMRLKPRHLSPEDHATIVSHVAPAVRLWRDSGRTPRVGVVAMNCSDCSVYARELEAALAEAGFEAVDTTAMLPTRSFEVDPNNPDDLRQGITVRYDPQFFVNAVPGARFVDAVIAG